MVYQEQYPSCSAALKRERSIKRMTRKQKVVMVKEAQRASARQTA